LEGKVKTYQQRREKKDDKPKPQTAFLSCIYVAIIAVVSFILAGLVMEQLDLFNELGIADLEIPLIHFPGRDIPEWALQLVVAAVIFFVLQTLVVVVTGLFGRREKGDEYS
jgi:TRAP-type C4-dicarboxylate transport system permease small subunit